MVSNYKGRLWHFASFFLIRFTSKPLKICFLSSGPTKTWTFAMTGTSSKTFLTVRMLKWILLLIYEGNAICNFIEEIINTVVSKLVTWGKTTLIISGTKNCERQGLGVQILWIFIVKKIKKHRSTFFAVHENKCVRKIFRFETKCDFFYRFWWKFTRWFMLVPEDSSYWRDWCWYHQTKCHEISLWAPSKFKSIESPGNKIF